MNRLVNEVLTPDGQNYLYDQTTFNLTTAPGPVLGYVSHGAHADAPNYMDNLAFVLAPGAVFHSYESFNAYSFVEDGNRFNQGLIGDWLAMGGTAGLGHVQEPRAQTSTVADESILFDRLLRGFSFVEAAWAATAQLSYVNTVVGDPLMTFRRWVSGDANDDGIVSLIDLTLVLGNWNRNVGSSAMQGDINGDGFVGFQDLNLVLGNWPQTTAAPAEADNIPTPGTALLCLPLTAALLGRRRAT